MAAFYILERNFDRNQLVSGPTPDSPKARMPIDSKAQLIDELAQGSKPEEQWRIGTEHEKFPFLTDTLGPVPYEGPRSIKALLEGLRDRFGWTGVLEGGNIIALSDPKGLGNVSLEPGGQFELSGAPLETVHDTCEEVPLRPRHDVPDLHRSGEPRLRVGGRHGEEAARLAGAAAHRHRALRQFAVP
jgi:hypothetical protein